SASSPGTACSPAPRRRRACSDVRRQAQQTRRRALMLYSQVPAAEKRRLFRERLAGGELLRFPGAFNPLSARLIQRKGFEGVYISGAVPSVDLRLAYLAVTP